MYISLTDEQVLLREAAAEALSRRSTVADARAALEGAPPESLWPVAIEAGWTGLLSGEDADGAALGAYEAMLVLEACGRVLADSRLLGHLPAVAMLEAAGFDAGLRTSLASGTRRAALVDADLSVAEDGAFSGVASSVLDAPGADVLVLISGDVAGVIDANAPGVVVSPSDAYDATRSLASVRLSGAFAEPLGAPGGLGRDLQRALLAAESVGAADGCLAMARDYAVDRVAFGRPIGSYQAIKHKLVEMLRRVEGARSLLVAAGRAWDSDRAGFGLLANAARVSACEALDYAAPENIFIHGGIGATWEHDASLYYRRAELSRRLCGGVEAAAEAVAGELLGASR